VHGNYCFVFAFGVEILRSWSKDLDQLAEPATNVVFLPKKWSKIGVFTQITGINEEEKIFELHKTGCTIFNSRAKFLTQAQKLLRGTDLISSMKSESDQKSFLRRWAAAKASPNSGLPDLSWYKIPKRGKYTKLTRTIPNVHKI
jgi:hypothetical protein